MAGILFLIVIFIALVIIGSLTKAMGCGPFMGGLFALVALAAFIGWLEAAHIFR